MLFNEQLIKCFNNNSHLPWEPSKVLITIYQFYNEKNSAMFGIYKHVI